MLLTVGVIGTACASNDAGGTPGRVGIAPPLPTLPEVEDPPSDVTLLRTAQSMEYTALELYKALTATGELSADEATLFDRIVQDHTRHADEVGQLITGAGGRTVRVRQPVHDGSLGQLRLLAAMKGTDDAHRDVLNIAWAFRVDVRGVVPEFRAPAARPRVAHRGSAAQRRGATPLDGAGALINPDADLFADVLRSAGGEGRSTGSRFRMRSRRCSAR